MPVLTTSLPLPSDLKAAALFLDFDGTLAEIVERPEAVSVRASTRHALAVLAGALGGAVAIVTGRDIAVIDHLIAPLHLPIAGVHGLVRRDAAGAVYGDARDDAFLSTTAQRLQVFAERHAGVLVERKTRSVALHYRVRPDLEAECIAAMDEAVAGFTGIQVKLGKMVVEAKPDRADKGTAVAEFLAEQPFKGRRPIFAGDDLTDEDAFAVVNARGGMTIKIGEGPTCANHRAGGIEDFLAWLEAAAAELEQGAES